MARRPFFSGNYGSALGSTANAANLIARAGATQGQAMANMGAQIGGMIQQYGLNKEKQKENKATIKSASGILERMKKLDPENEPQYMMQIEELNNEDMGLGMRAKLADKALQGLSITNQMQNQILNRDTQRQALGLAKRTEDLTVENLKLGNRQKELGTLLSKISLDKLNAIKDEDTRVALLTLKERGKDLLQGDQRRELQKATMTSEADLLPLRTDAEKAKLKAVPRQVERQEELSDLQLKAAERADTSADLLLEAFGGAKRKAEFDYKGAKLNRKVIKEGIKLSQKRGEYYHVLSNKKVPVDTRKDYAAIQSNIGKIASSTLKDPQTGKQITFADYMDLHADEPKLYPLTGDGAGPAASLYGAYITEQKLADDLLKTTQVQVNDGQGSGATQSIRSSMDVGSMQPQQAMQQIQDRIGQIRRQLPQLNLQEKQLGQPGQMTTTAFDTSPFGNIETPLAQRPQTISDIQNSDILKQRSQLMAELEQLEAQRQQLGQKFGLR